MEKIKTYLLKLDYGVLCQSNEEIKQLKSEHLDLLPDWLFTKMLALLRNLHDSPTTAATDYKNCFQEKSTKNCLAIGRFSVKQPLTTLSNAQTASKNPSKSMLNEFGGVLNRLIKFSGKISQAVIEQPCIRISSPSSSME
ncbi:hypothetical protein HUJ04_001910 [Dendroctonus ponderosae]|nr:hypothetical protein HUJ04_001910 [Dendroctonus ponderosae]KAH1017571.1 hypothetical protein HUJ05_008187 [Dendroctonus ponderosae]